MHDYIRKKHKEELLPKLKIVLIDNSTIISSISPDEQQILITYDKYCTKLSDSLPPSTNIVIDIDSTRIGSKYLSDFLYSCRKLLDKQKPHPS